MDNIYRLGGNDRLNLSLADAQYRKNLLVAVRAFDNAKGIPKSQQMKHSCPNWLLVLACLPANDTGEFRTIDEIDTIISDLEYPIGRKAVLNIFRPMVSKNPNTREKLSQVVIDNLELVGGIKSSSVMEDGVKMNGYTLGCGLAKLQKLVDDKQFISYSFNFNDYSGIKLLGI